MYKPLLICHKIMSVDTGGSRQLFEYNIYFLMIAICDTYNVYALQRIIITSEIVFMCKTLLELIGKFVLCHYNHCFVILRMLTHQHTKLLALYSCPQSNMQLPLTYNIHNITHLKIQFVPLHVIYTYQ